MAKEIQGLGSHLDCTNLGMKYCFLIFIPYRLCVMLVKWTLADLFHCMRLNLKSLFRNISVNLWLLFQGRIQGGDRPS